MRDTWKNIAQRAFLTGDRIGVHVLPSHYYSSVASRKTLRRTEPQWRRTLDPIPFAWDVDAQADWLTGTAQQFPREVTLASFYQSSEAVGGVRYGPIEGQFLHSYIRSQTPGRIVEIGSGSSTLLMSRAIERNIAEGKPATKVTAFDPYTASRVAGLPYVDAREVGGLDIQLADLALEAGDLLFIDSTHTVRTGSELSHLYLEILPNLPAGVVVHIHDIYLPYLYSPNIYRTMFDWQETTLLAGLLAGSDKFQILMAMSGLFHARPEVLRSVFPEFRPMAMHDGIRDDGAEGHFPESFWMRVERD